MVVFTTATKQPGSKETEGQQGHCRFLSGCSLHLTSSWGACMGCMQERHHSSNWGKLLRQLLHAGMAAWQVSG
eukprot:8602244-Prorocentrum_lima.AAC.1